MFESGYVYEGKRKDYIRWTNCPRCEGKIREYWGVLDKYYNRFGAIMPLPVREKFLKVLRSQIQKCCG